MKTSKIIICLTTLLAFAHLQLKAQQTITYSDRNQILFNEVMVQNLDVFVDPSWNYGSWVELYNLSTKSYNLKGCWISDEPLVRKKVHLTQNYILPANGFLNLWFGHADKYCATQINLKLDIDGGLLYLSDSDGRLLQALEYPASYPRTSYARKGDGATDWSYSSIPTPAAPNDTTHFATEQLPSPVPSIDSRKFSGTLQVTVPIPEGCTLRYTLDGSVPLLTNKLAYTSTTGKITITKSTTLRVALYKPGYLPSEVVTRTYINEKFDIPLPIVAVTTAPTNLYSDTLGIFVRGVNGRAGLGESTACNWNMDWDRPMNFEFFDAEGQNVINQECTMGRFGAWSRRYTPYGFKMHAEKAFGPKNFSYAFFSQKPYVRHKQILLRCAGNDNSCRVRDPAVQTIVLTSGLDVDGQAYEPVVHYINGLYRGTLNLREPNNKNFAYANYGYDDDEIDFFEMDGDSGYVQKAGTREAFERLYELSKTASTPSSYEQIKQLLDIDEICNYMAVELYMGNDDWPKNNLKAWRPIAEDGKFRFIMYDIDHAFGLSSPFSSFASKKTWTWNRLYGEPVTNITGEVEIVTIFLNLLKNTEFCRHFVDAFCIVAGSVFEPTRCEEIIRSICTRVETIQQQPDNGYGKNSSPWGTGNTLISKYKTRQDDMYNALKNYSTFGLTKTTAQQILLDSDVPGARLFVNDQIIPTGQLSGKLFPPVTLRAEAPAGYQFEGWKLMQGSLSSTYETIFGYGTTWSYYDQGSLDGTAWNTSGYSSSSWGGGNTPMGYAKDNTGYATVLSYGDNASSKHPTYYFRRAFILNKLPNAEQQFVLNYSVDDGMIVYVNGKEAGRYNMPAGTTTFGTFATTYTSGNPDKGSLVLPSDLFVSGRNLLAVEVHNNNLTSSDIYWDAELQLVTPDKVEQPILSTEPEMKLPEGNNLHIQATYKPIDMAGKSMPNLYINEVSASNSMYVNDYFKKADWLELYNPTADTIDVAGMYLSDKIDKPHKFQIPNGGDSISTIVPPGGYCVVWCDGQEPLNQLHASFKLANADTCVVMITAEDDSWADTLVYRHMEGTESVGRFPDGGTSLYLMSRPTIHEANILTSLTQVWNAPSPGSLVDDSDGINLLASRSAELSISINQGQLIIHGVGDDNVMLSITTLAGIEVLRSDIQLMGGRQHIGLSPLPSGVYIAHVEDTDGNSCELKFSR